MSMSSRGSSRTVLVAGAGGFLGASVVEALVKSGWSARGLVRRPSTKSRVEAVGGDAVTGDVLDLPSVEAVARGCDAIVHLAANPSGAAEPEALARVRVEGCRNLVRVARSLGIPRLVVGSGYWVYADNPGTITEASALDPRGESYINLATERAAIESSTGGSPEIMVVRPGMVYGDGSWFRPVAEGILRREYRYIAGGSNPWSFVALADAGQGFVSVLERGVSGEVYNLVDGRPAPWREFGDFVAERLACATSASLSPAEAVKAYGPDVAHHLEARRACSSKKIETLGWKPRFPTYREGLVELLPRMKFATASRR